MPTVIDELIVLLGLDTSAFTKGQREAAAAFLQTKQQAESQGKAIEAVGKKMLEGFVAIQNRVASIFALFVGGRSLKEFYFDMTALNAETARTSRQFGTNVRELSTWRGAVEAAGGDANGLTQSFTGLVTEFQRFSLTGESSVIPWFRTLGIDISDANGKMRKTGDVLLDLADKAHALKDNAKATTILQAIGLDAGTINLLLKGRVAVQGFLDAQKRNALTQEDADNAERAAKAWKEMDQAAHRLGNNLVTAVGPGLTWLINKTTELFKLWNQSPEELKKGGADLHKGLRSRFGEPPKWLQDFATQLGWGIDNVGDRLEGKPDTHKGAWNARSTLPPEARALLDTIAGPESGGRYNALYGVNKSFSDYSKHPNVHAPITTGPNAGRTTTAAGKYQFLSGTWNEAQKALSLPDFSPASQDQAAWWLAQRDYKTRTGRDLLADLKDPNRRNGVGQALAGTWTSLPGGIEAGTSNSSFARALDAASRRASPSAANPLIGALAGASGGTNGGTTNMTTVGKIEIYTDQKTATGLVGEMASALAARSLAAQAQTGPQ